MVIDPPLQEETLEYLQINGQSRAAGRGRGSAKGTTLQLALAP